VNDCNEILISIRSEYVAKILAGEKTVELRRRQLKVLPGTRMWIYSKGPQGAVKACAVIKDVVRAGPDRLWRRFQSEVGVTYGEFQSYFGTSEDGCALILDDVIALRKQITLCAMREKVPSFHPPQFYAKLDHKNPTLRALRAGIART
jgi:predicted transcriptional regulator